MKTHINNIFFEGLRGMYKMKDAQKITKALIPLIDYLKVSSYLNDKLHFHPLGFIYGRLHNFDDGESIRIHIWNEFAKTQKPAMAIHNHYYDISSFVYKGQMNNNVFKQIDESPPTHSVYQAEYQSSNIRILSKKGTSSHLSLERIEFIKEGTLYSLTREEIHSGQSHKAKETVTVVYTEHPGNPSPLIFGPLKGKQSYKYLSASVPEKIVHKIRSRL